jgi:hypothetical protein
MEHKDSNQNQIEYRLGLALLQLLEKRVDIELQRAGAPNGLVLDGTLLRAFDTPNQPSLTLMIGAHTIAIRPSRIKRIAIDKSTDHLQAVHLLLPDDFQLHLAPHPNPKHPQ